MLLPSTAFAGLGVTGAGHWEERGPEPVRVRSEGGMSRWPHRRHGHTAACPITSATCLRVRLPRERSSSLMRRCVTGPSPYLAGHVLYVQEAGDSAAFGVCGKETLPKTGVSVEDPTGRPRTKRRRPR